MQCEMTEEFNRKFKKLMDIMSCGNSMTAERAGEILAMPKTRKAKRLRKDWYVPREITMQHQVLSREPIDARTRSDL